MASSTGYACPFCGDLSPTLKLYVSHLRVIHSKDANFSVLCGVRGCREVFRTFSAFNSHVYHHHRSEVGVTNAAAGAGPCSILEENGSNDVNYDIADVVDYSEFTALTAAFPGAPSDLADDRGAHCRLSSASSVNSDVFNRLQKQTAAKMMLQLREGRQVSQIALTEIISSCRQLCSQAIDNLKMEVRAVLVDQPKNDTIEQVLEKRYDPFHDIDTNYLFEKYCVQELGCLVSICELYMDA